MHYEATRITNKIGADAWFVADGASGPFTASTSISEDRVAEVAALPGVENARPLIALKGTVNEPGKSRKDINIVGLDGEAPGPGQAIVDKRLGFSKGDQIVANGVPLTVADERGGITFYFGTPTIIVGITDAQAMGFGGERNITAVITDGSPQQAPEGLDLLTSKDVIADLNRVAKSGTQTIDFINILLWIVAVGIVGSVIYISVLERTRDLAVFKATGARTRSLFAAIATEAVPLMLVATAVAIVLARLLQAGFPFTIVWKSSDFIRLVVLGVLTGLLAGLIGLRRAAKTDPALAFRGGQ